MNLSLDELTPEKNSVPADQNSPKISEKSSEKTPEKNPENFSDKSSPEISPDKNSPDKNSPDKSSPEISPDQKSSPQKKSPENPDQNPDQNFDQNFDKNPDKNSAPKSSPISALNAQSATTQPSVDLDKIKISPQKSSRRPDLAKVSSQTPPPAAESAQLRQRTRYARAISAFFVGLGILLLAQIFARISRQFLDPSAQRPRSARTAATELFVPDHRPPNFQNSTEILDSSLPLRSKKRELSQLLTARLDDYRRLASQLQPTLGISQFMPALPADIFGYPDRTTASLQRLLLARESTKFSVANKLFQNYDSFLDEFAGQSRRSAAETRELMTTISSRGNRDIDLFLQNCFLNPTQIPQLCARNPDLVYFYSVADPRSGVDPDHLVALLNFLEDQLENSTIPRLSLKITDLNPVTQTLKISLTLNSFPDDERALLARGIANPHVEMLTLLIDELKTSPLLIGEEISAKNLQIQTQTIFLDGREIVIKTTSESFEVPVQKSVEREIFDAILVR